MMQCCIFIRTISMSKTISKAAVSRPFVTVITDTGDNGVFHASHFKKKE